MNCVHPWATQEGRIELKHNTNIIFEMQRQSKTIKNKQLLQKNISHASTKVNIEKEDISNDVSKIIEMLRNNLIN